MHPAVRENFKALLSALAVTLLVPASAAAAQGNNTPLSLGYGIDSSSVVVREILRTVSGYLSLSRPGYADTQAPGFTPNPYWHPTEQSERPLYDPASAFTMYNAPATVLQVTPDVPDDSVYVVKILYATVSASGAVRPTALQRFYVMRHSSRWVLTSALDRMTKQWLQTSVGRIDYSYPPDHAFDLDRAQRAVDFADSLAAGLGVSLPDTIEYYMTGSVDQMTQALGFDWLLVSSGPRSGYGGWAGGNRVYSADPRLGEAYLHELVHVITGPLRSATGRHPLIEEGFASWAGGMRIETYTEALPELVEFQQLSSSHNWAQLRSAFTTNQRLLQLSGALVVDAVYRQQGWPGVRKLLEVNTTDRGLFAALEELLGITEEEFEPWWRLEATEALAAQRR